MDGLVRMSLSYRLYAGEPAWTPQGTHIIEENGRVRMLEADETVTFESPAIFERARGLIEERRDRMTAFQPSILPPASTPSSQQAIIDNLIDRLATVEARMAGGQS